MNKEFTKHNQALALKELGFKEDCFGYYGYSKKLYINSNYKDAYNLKELVVAPTYSQAFRWFREKHKLHSTITSISQESWQWHITKPGESLGKLYNEDFYTYEEAESACLDKLIEIIKNK